MRSDSSASTACGSEIFPIDECCYSRVAKMLRVGERSLATGSLGARKRKSEDDFKMFKTRPVPIYGTDYAALRETVRGVEAARSLDMLRAVRAFLEPERWEDTLTEAQARRLHIVNYAEDFAEVGPAFDRELAYVPVLAASVKDDTQLLLATFSGTAIVFDMRFLTRARGGEDALPATVRRALQSEEVLKLVADLPSEPVLAGCALRIAPTADTCRMYERLVDRFVIRPSGPSGEEGGAERAMAWAMNYHPRTCSEETWMRLIGGHR